MVRDEKEEEEGRREEQKEEEEEEEQEKKKEKEARMNTATLPNIIPAPSIAKSNIASKNSLKRKKVCNICMDSEADVVFMPCRHMCACSSCGDRLANCPICRKSIDHYIKVYV